MGHDKLLNKTQIRQKGVMLNNGKRLFMLSLDTRYNDQSQFFG